jgi:predicted nucleotidyltransferase
MAAEMPWLVFATVSGSHMFGFPSVDSDFDIRGMHVEPPRSMLGLEQPIETREQLDGDFDFVSQEARKFLLLLFKNGNVLEQLWSPLVISTTPEHET